MSSLPRPITQPAATAAENRPATVRALADLTVLLKPRVTLMIVMAAWCGFFFAAHKSVVSSTHSLATLAHALFGIFLVAGGTAALNQVMERDSDGLMRRTALRPLPANRLGLRTALAFGIVLTATGIVYLVFQINMLTALLTLATSAMYLAVYTPLKKISPICTFIGALPGAMPPLLGWTAMRGRLEWEGVTLFAILFLWQFPHFYSIAWLYSEDYDNAAIRMLPVVDRDGRSTRRETLLYGIALLPVGLAPVFLHMSGWIYGVASLLLGAWYLSAGMRLGREGDPFAPQSKKAARQLLRASVIYLPLLFLAMMLNAR